MDSMIIILQQIRKYTLILVNGYSFIFYQLHSPQVTAHNWRVGGLLHLMFVFVFAQVQVLDLPFDSKLNGSSVSVQQFRQVFGQASFTPPTFLHLQAVDFLLTHPSQVFTLVHPLSPGLTAENPSMLSVQDDVGGATGAVVGGATGAVVGDDTGDGGSTAGAFDRTSFINFSAAISSFPSVLVKTMA